MVKGVSVTRVSVLMVRDVLKTMTALMVPFVKALRAYQVNVATTLTAVYVRYASRVAVSGLNADVIAIAPQVSAVTQGVASRVVA